MLLLAFVLSARLSSANPDIQYQQPQLAATGDTVGVAFGAGKSVYVAISRDGGQSFSAPFSLPGPELLALGRHRGPRIAMIESAVAVSAITSGAGDLMAWHSKDGGRTWSAGVRINDVEGSAREGLHAMTAGGGGQFYAVWLDLRGEGTRLYGASSSDGGATWSKNVLVYESAGGTICECCHPSVAIDSGGEIHAMWRNALGGNRDMYLARSRDGGLTWSGAQKLGNRTWTLNACPMDGGGLALDPEGRAVTVWRREKAIYETRPGTPERQIGEGKDPAVVVTGRGVFVAWKGPAGILTRTPSNMEPVILDPSGAYVQLVARRDGSALAAWECGGNISFAILK
jgi:hypothetical protein